MLFKKEKDTVETETGCSCQHCMCEDRAKKVVEEVFSELLRHSIVVESPNSKGEFIEVVRMTDVYYQLCDGHKIDARSTIYGEDWG